MFNPDELRKDPKYWETIRHDSLSKNEKSVYRMVDSVKNVPIFKTYQNIIYTLSSGFWDFHKFELGNLYSCYNNNPVEGDRVRLALATGTDFSKQVKVMGYGAYGFNDKQFKWGGKFQINLQRYPQRTILGGGYRQDIDVQSANSEEQGQGSLLSGIFRRDIPQKLLYLDESKIFLERWWTQGWSTRLTLLHYYMDPFDNSDGAGGGLNFFYIDKPSGEIRTNVRTTEIIFKARYAYGEKFIDNTFTRINLGTKYPRVSFQYSAGLKGVIGSQYEYQKVSLALDHWFYVGPLGWTSYHVKVGKTFGTLPYLLLEVPPGNETFMYAPENFSLMNRFEFASDFYGSLRLDHHFDGFFFNHIPLLRKLKLREVATFRAYWGSLSAENQAANALNYVDKAHQQPLRAANGVPYMEVGVGVENIFKFVQFHWMWRINYLDNPEAPHFTPMLGLRFDF